MWVQVHYPGRDFRKCRGNAGESESGKRERSVIRGVVVSGSQLWAAGPTSCGDSRRARHTTKACPAGGWGAGTLGTRAGC